MNERTDGVSRGWYSLGPYRVLALGLHLNPYFTTHRIHRDGIFVGAQLSVPTPDDCRWHDHREGQYARKQESKPNSSWQLRIPQHRPGRPTNAERARREATLLTEIPE